MPVSFLRSQFKAKEPEVVPRSELEQLIGSIKFWGICNIPVADLKPNPRNAKKHGPRQIGLLVENFNTFGYTQPIIIDDDDNILAGHARYAAALELKLPYLPCTRVRDLSGPAKRALALADNKLAELGEWDLEILSEEVKELSVIEDLDFDLNITGFDTGEVDGLLIKDERSDPADRAVPVQTRAVCRIGEIWICGDHRLVCGDFADGTSLDSLMRSETAGIVFTDPPYNVPNRGHVTKRKNVREFAQGGGEMSDAQFTDFLRKVCEQIKAHSSSGAVVQICMDWRHYPNLLSAAQPIFGAPKNVCVWVKTNAGMGTFYRSQHEFVVPFVVPGAKPTNNFRLGGKGRRFRTNVWEYPGFNSFGRERDDALEMHPTVKPVAMVMDALRDCSDRNEIVLDIFGGSGTTMIAAERTGRRARIVEIDPLYCDTIIRRWQKFTKKSAVHSETQQTFDEVAVERLTDVRGTDNAR